MTTIGKLARRALTLTITICMTQTMTAQLKQFTLEDLNFGGTNYHNMRPKNLYLAWWGDRLMYQDAEEWGVVDMESGRKTPAGTIDEVNKALGKKEINSAMNAKFPYPGQPLVLLKGSRLRVLYNWKKGRVAWAQPCQGEQYSDWAAPSRAVAFVKDSQLCVTDAEGQTRQITTDGSREIVYGQAVHRNEFGIVKGTFWSTDGKRLAFYRMDQSMVTDYPQVNTFARVAELEPDKYPMAGMTSHKVTVGVYDMATGKTAYLDAGDPTDRYFSNVAWSQDSKTVYMIELNRDQTDFWLRSYNAATGKLLATLYHEHNDKYVHPVSPIAFLPWDDSKFLLQSERDGYNHLYLFDTKGRCLRQVTSGRWVVLDLVGFNTKQKSAIIVSNEASPIQNNLYAVDVETGRRTPLDNGRGLHAYYFARGAAQAMLSASGKWLFDHYTEPDVPRNVCVTNTATGRSTQIFSAPDPWAGYAVPEYSCGTIKAADDSTDLYFRMVKPIGFDPAKKYPTIVYVYGGPGVRNVEAGWHYQSRSWETYMAQKGYLLFILDNRGSSDRGREFEQATFRHLGQREMDDQMRGVAYLKSLAYVDTTRIGVHGWSYGGFMTTSLMTTYPDVFKVGVAGGPVIDWKWYEVMYGERYMDTPEANPEGYAETSLLAKAKNLKGKLQIIIGANDPTVVPQHALQFLEACIEAGKQPDFFVYPGEGHNMAGHKSVHLHERITQYFEDWLK